MPGEGPYEAQARAQDREQMAIDAMKQYGDALRGTPELKNNPALTELRARLLQEPQRFFRSLRAKLQSHPETMPDALARLAMANFELGSITYELGDKEDALQALEGSLAIRERLAREIPGLPQFASELAASLNFIGRVKTDLGRLPEALTAHERAHAIRERLARENPKPTSFQRDLAWSLNNIALVYSKMGRSAEAIELYERSRTIFERLARENPKETRNQIDLAWSHGNIADLEEKLGRLSQALASREQALTVSARLAREKPSIVPLEHDVVSTYNSIGNLQRKMGRSTDALASYEEARAILEREGRQHPESPELASDMGTILNNIARIDLDNREYKQAAEKLARAIECQRKALATNPRNPGYRQLLINHLSNLIRAAEGLGNVDQANEARRELAAADPSKAALDARLAAVLQGEQTPKDELERTQLADRAYEKSQYASSARLYAEALANDPKLGNDRQAPYAYNAACAAALAGCGQGNDVPPPDDVARAKLRQQARAWLEAELAAWGTVLDGGPAELKAVVPQTLKHWKSDADLAGIRDGKELAKLPEDERAAFQQLWNDVDTLLTKAAGSK
jgi:tetratricopeptide (TPR) repeat protein